MFIWQVIAVILITEFAFSEESAKVRLPIVYVYTVVESACRHGFPTYIKVSLEQAVLSQPDCDVIMASNYGECKVLDAEMDTIPGIIKHDISLVPSNRSKEFINVSTIMFAANTNRYLWVTSAQRFFAMEDYMIEKGYNEMIHVEADNLLYGKVSNEWLYL
jgi:hypothetical protein